MRSINIVMVCFLTESFTSYKSHAKNVLLNWKIIGFIAQKKE